MGHLAPNTFSILLEHEKGLLHIWDLWLPITLTLLYDKKSYLFNGLSDLGLLFIKCTLFYTLFQMLFSYTVIYNKLSLYSGCRHLESVEGLVHYLQNHITHERWIAIVLLLVVYISCIHFNDGCSLHLHFVYLLLLFRDYYVRKFPH